MIPQSAFIVVLLSETDDLTLNAASGGQITELYGEIFQGGSTTEPEH
jgi:hypothetical protein